jgi:hypothetical protein
MIELVDPCNVWMLFLRGDVKRLLGFLGIQGIQILQDYIAAPLLLCVGCVVAASWWTGCKTIRHMTDCVATIPLYHCICLHGPWSQALAKNTAQPSPASFHIRRAYGRHEMSHHLRMPYDG